MDKKRYPSDVSDEEWELVAPYLTLMSEEVPQRQYPMREVFNGLRFIAKTGAPWRYMPNDLPPWEVVYQQSQRWLSAGYSTSCPSRCTARIAVGRWRTKTPRRF